MKKCNMCFTEKPITEFYNSTKSGTQYICIECAKAHHKAWQAQRKESAAKVVPMSKICKKCAVEKPISQFGKRSINLDKKNIYCKECWRGITKNAARKHYQKKKTERING